ncbi:Single-stranded DNA-binding protein A [bioreactor metagenome]|uniref:Single-stranded DNA-binding protein A n=1 Tax=bioreactor metagenome TaxID=1076179 RepID=A0A645FV35_9ZZZZ
MNSVILIGRTTKEPELKILANSGTAVANFNIAVDREFQVKGKDKMTDFFNIVIFGKSAEYAANYLKKGKLCAVKGSIQNRTYETKEGEKRYITEIVADRLQILEWEKEQNNANENNYTEAQIDDEDLPFQ